MINGAAFAAVKVFFDACRRKNWQGEKQKAENRSGFSRLVLGNARRTFRMVPAVLMVVQRQNKTDITGKEKNAYNGYILHPFAEPDRI